MAGIKYFIGLDIGGTNTRGILWDGKKIIKSYETKTPQTIGVFKNKLKKLVARLSMGRKIAGIGIGSSGVIDGTVLRFSPNIPKVKNLNFKKIIGPHPIMVDNDARCFARGEYLLGEGKKFKSIFALTIGTGIGRAYGKNGKILKIKKFEYAEPWERKYQKIRDRKNDAELAEFLGKHLAKLIKPYKPEAIIIGGGVVTGRKGLFSKLKKSFLKNDIKAKILKSKLGKHSASIGAVLFFKQ